MLMTALIRRALPALSRCLLLAALLTAPVAAQTPAESGAAENNQVSAKLLNQEQLAKLIKRKKLEEVPVTFEVTWPLLPLPAGIGATKTAEITVLNDDLADAEKNLAQASPSAEKSYLRAAGVIGQEAGAVEMAVRGASLLQVRQALYSRGEVFGLLLSNGLAFTVDNGGGEQPPQQQDIRLVFEGFRLPGTANANLWRATAKATLTAHALKSSNPGEPLKLTVRARLLGKGGVARSLRETVVSSSDIVKALPEEVREDISPLAIKPLSEETLMLGEARPLLLLFSGLGGAGLTNALNSGFSGILQSSSFVSGAVTGGGTAPFAGLQANLLPNSKKLGSPRLIAGLTAKDSPDPIIGLSFGAERLRKLGLDNVFFGVRRFKDSTGDSDLRGAFGFAVGLGKNPNDKAPPPITLTASIEPLRERFRSDDLLLRDYAAVWGQIVYDRSESDEAANRRADDILQRLAGSRPNNKLKLQIAAGHRTQQRSVSVKEVDGAFYYLTTRLNPQGLLSQDAFRFRLLDYTTSSPQTLPWQVVPLEPRRLPELISKNFTAQPVNLKLLPPPAASPAASLAAPPVAPSVPPPAILPDSLPASPAVLPYNVNIPAYVAPSGNEAALRLQLFKKDAGGQIGPAFDAMAAVYDGQNRFVETRAPTRINNKSFVTFKTNIVPGATYRVRLICPGFVPRDDMITIVLGRLVPIVLNH